MPTLDQHQSNQYTKMIVLGNPGTGKTGGLASLVKADYWLGILDYDNGLDPLKQHILHECPDKISNVEFRTLRDKRSNEGVIGQALAFPTGLKMLDRWKYDDVDLGPPAEWGPDRILAIDSLSHMAKGAFDWSAQLKPSKDPRMNYYHAQQAIDAMLGNISSELFRTNVIVITHINYIDQEDGTLKGFPNAIGKALSPMIGSYFNSIALCSVKGGKRVIQTTPTAMIDLKNPAPFAMLPEYPISTGLADFFAVLRNEK